MSIAWAALAVGWGVISFLSWGEVIDPLDGTTPAISGVIAYALSALNLILMKVETR